MCAALGCKAGLSPSPPLELQGVSVWKVPETFKAAANTETQSQVGSSLCTWVPIVPAVEGPQPRGEAAPICPSAGTGQATHTGSIVPLRTAQAFPGGWRAEQQPPALSCPQTQALGDRRRLGLRSQLCPPGGNGQCRTPESSPSKPLVPPRPGEVGPLVHVTVSRAASRGLRPLEVPLAASGTRLLDSRRTLPAIMTRCHQTALPRPGATFNREAGSCLISREGERQTERQTDRGEEESGM